ncbi:MAG TPA: hypothetical protein PKL31_09765 [Fulvivirga sp.]|nr:hypothetical protein [Fulvivirga sp.]
MTNKLLLALPLTLIAVIFYVGFTGDLTDNIKHLFFLSASTFIVYGYQVSKNQSFSFLRKVYWCMLLFLIPSVSAVIYWVKYLKKESI